MAYCLWVGSEHAKEASKKLGVQASIVKISTFPLPTFLIKEVLAVSEEIFVVSTAMIFHNLSFTLGYGGGKASSSKL